MAKRSILPWVMASLGLAGCSFGSTDGPEATPPEESPLAAQERPFTIAVLERRASVPLPVRGALVVLDKPGGGRVSATTGADGRAVFADVDFARGEGAITIIERDHVMRSFVGLSAASLSTRGGTSAPKTAGDVQVARDVSFFVPRATGTDRATLSGALLNKQAASHFVTLGANVDGGSFQSTRASYSLDVQKDRAFSVFGVEWSPAGTSTVSKRGIEQTFFRWVRWDHPGLRDDATAPLDFASGAALTPVRTRARIVIPGGARGALGIATKGYATVGASGSAMLGGTARSDVNAAGDAFDCELEHVEVDTVTPVTDFVIAREDGAVSYFEKIGYPEDGLVADGLLLPPEPPAGVQALFGEVPFRGLDGESSPRLLVRDGFGTVRWIVDAPAGRTSLVPPMLDAPGIAQLGGADRARLVALADYDARTGGWARMAASREISLAR
jgi:hypothetical protein